LLVFKVYSFIGCKDRLELGKLKIRESTPLMKTKEKQ
jgi:hypothetical protein